jgi:hypothetical protein
MVIAGVAAERMKAQTQGAHGRVAGPAGPVVQRGQDADRDTGGRIRFSRVHDPPARRHAGTPARRITRPSKAAIKRVKHRLAVEIRALPGANAAAVLAKINPIVRGWANYFPASSSVQNLRGPGSGWTKIVRHSLVLGAASPDDPALTDYWPGGAGRFDPPVSVWPQR